MRRWIEVDIEWSGIGAVDDREKTEKEKVKSKEEGEKERAGFGNAIFFPST